MTTATERVAKGAAWLDRVQPGWEKVIDLPDLDLSSTCNCVCGQVFAPATETFSKATGFDVALNVYGLRQYKNDARLSVTYGFDVGWDTDNTYAEYDQLQDAWEVEIKQRLR